MTPEETAKWSVNDSSFIEISEHAVQISDEIAFRISSDTKPSKWKTTDLQKGMRLVYNGTDVAGEGTGFGVPVLQYSGDLYFSGKSRLFISQRKKMLVIRKEFLMDRIPRRSIGNSRIQSRILLASGDLSTNSI